MPEDYQYQGTRFITCPYCGEEDRDSWEYSDVKGDCEIECSKCEKTFILEEPERSISYTTRPMVEAK